MGAVALPLLSADAHFEPPLNTLLRGAASPAPVKPDENRRVVAAAAAVAAAPPSVLLKEPEAFKGGAECDLPPPLRGCAVLLPGRVCRGAVLLLAVALLPASL